MKEETRVRHLLHIILSVLTCGLWLAVYGIQLAANELNNRVVRGYNQGWKDAHVSISQRKGSVFLGRIGAGGPSLQATMTAQEADEYEGLANMRANNMSDYQRTRYEELRSRFA